MDGSAARPQTFVNMGTRPRFLTHCRRDGTLFPGQCREHNHFMLLLVSYLRRNKPQATIQELKGNAITHSHWFTVFDAVNNGTLDSPKKVVEFIMEDQDVVEASQLEESSVKTPSK